MKGQANARRIRTERYIIQWIVILCFLHGGLGCFEEETVQRADVSFAGETGVSRQIPETTSMSNKGENAVESAFSPRRWFIDQIDAGIAAVMDGSGKVYWVKETSLPVGAVEGLYYISAGDNEKLPPDCAQAPCRLQLEYTLAEIKRISSVREKLLQSDDGRSVVRL